MVADGEHEQFIRRDHTEMLARLVPGAKLLILPNVAHGGPQQDLKAFHRAVQHVSTVMALGDVGKPHSTGRKGSDPA